MVARHLPVVLSPTTLPEKLEQAAEAFLRVAKDSSHAADVRFMRLIERVRELQSIARTQTQNVLPNISQKLRVPPFLRLFGDVVGHLPHLPLSIPLREVTIVAPGGRLCVPAADAARSEKMAKAMAGDCEVQVDFGLAAVQAALAPPETLKLSELLAGFQVLRFLQWGTRELEFLGAFVDRLILPPL